jgi:hypothetical protein
MSKLEMEKPIITLGTNPSGYRWWWVLLMILLWTPTWFLPRWTRAICGDVVFAMVVYFYSAPSKSK